MSANTIITIVVALVPAILLLIYIYFQDKYEKEPIGLLLIIFGLGILSCAPAMLFEWLFGMAIDVTFGGIGTISYWAVYAFFGVGIVEEFVKFIAAYLPTWRNRHFNYKFDGVVYCIFASMGFAALENVLYLVSYNLQNDFFVTNTRDTVIYGIQRGLLAIPAHGMCAIFMGYFYGNAKYLKSYGDRKGCRKSLIRGFIIAASLHAFYDFCLFTQLKLFWIIFLIFVVIADIFTILRIRKAKKEDQKMYEAPKYRQYWADADPYQLYGGYQAPAYGNYDYGTAQGIQQPAGQNQYMPNQGNQYMPQGGTQQAPAQPQGMGVQQSTPFAPQQAAQQQPVMQFTPGQQLMKCPNCGTVNNFAAFNCIKCGRSLHDLPDSYNAEY